MRTLKGIGVSPGVVIGKVKVLRAEEITVPKVNVKDSEIPNEIARFEEALTKTRAELLGIRRKISQEIGRDHSDIFNAHLLILEDRTLIEDVIGLIKSEKVTTEYAFSVILQRYFHAFSQIDDEYLKERISDIKDIGKRVLSHLMSQERESLVSLREAVIVVSHDLSPSDTATMDRKNVIGFATDIGGPTSHTAIMARSMEIPAVVGLERISKEVTSGDKLIIDGTHGLVIINPDESTVEKYLSEGKKFAMYILELEKLRNLPAETKDKHQVELAANIEFPDEIPSVISHGANGIGLYRTEYFYLNRQDLPTEEEQFVAYKTVAEQMKPNPVVVRTLDLGGDKFLSSLDVPREMNPFLGWRAIRFCLTRVDVFRAQLRAILRASHYGNLKIMYPMISNLDELRQAHEILRSVGEELTKEGIPYDKDIDVGAMIEIPSAAITSDSLAKEADFFSIGTNDLIQYSLAVDRVNEKIAYLYQPTHPAILRLIQQTIKNAHDNKIWVGICGEMSGDPVSALLMVGMGVDELSTSPFVLPKIKKVIRSVNFSDVKALAEKVLSDFHTAEEIRNYAEKELNRLIPGFSDEYLT
ncbi:MAG: phosphoenolpyruvate--protein phosphotransferase [Candidatus Omnitrophica bacterium]|nr:phosphoenolpyruvate--protein phosphotransferase [Candidatus Omnitrophota bacterium]